MAKHDTLERLSNQICGSQYLDFIPTTDATKPPHIANGLFRNCTGDTCDTSDLHRWIISEERTGSTSSEDIITEYHSILEKGNKENPENIKAFRFLLGEIFNQANTCYANYDFSVMTHTSHWMIKNRVPPEVHIGEFLFKILAKRIDGKHSPAIDAIKDALMKDDDEFTRLVKPIIAFPSEAEKRRTKAVEYDNDEDTLWDDCKMAIRRGFDQLTNSMMETDEFNNTLLVQRRFVCFSTFATLLYLAQSNAAVFSGNYTPLLIDGGGSLESVRKASEQSFTVSKKAVEEYYVNALRKILKESEQVKDTRESCSQWIESMIISSSKADESDKQREAIRSYYAGFLSQGDLPLSALARALQIALYTFEYKNTSPSTFCRVLGIRGGFVGPKGNRASHKRYLINSFTLETIVLSVLDSSSLREGLELKELGHRLFDSYHIVIGADPDQDYLALEKANIAQSTPGDLRGDLDLNAKVLADTLISLGLGRSYADGVTLIGWRL